ncbi:MAG: putative permease [Parasphingorhabdus sp.]|jgi:predicted permease
MLDLSLQILGIMLPSILLASIGVFWQRSGREFPRDFVTTLVLNISLPALIFFTLVTATVDSETLWTIGYAAVCVHILFLIVVFILMKVSGKDLRLAVAFTVGNTGNLGLPLCLLAFGETGLIYAITFFAIQSVFLFTIGEAIYAGRLDIWRILKSPTIYSIVAALTVRGLEIPVHQILLDTTQLVGQIVVPLMLITLGVAIAGMRATNLNSNLVWSLIRTLIAIAIGFGVAEWFELEGVVRGVLIIETIVPVAVFNYLLAYRHKMDSSEISGLILVTHLGALIYLPIVLAFVL